MGILTKIMSRRDDAVSDREFTVMSAVFFIIAAVVVLLNAEVAGALAFVTAICALLIFFSDTSLTLPPFMFLCIFVTRLHDAYDLFIPYVWMAAPVIISVAFHLIYYRKLSRPLFGKSIYGIAAVAVAVTLGGVGKITAAEYFAPAALYHTLGLGLGMIPLYVILRACYSRPGSANRIVSAMYLSGFFAAFFGGDLLDSLYAALCGLAVGVWMKYLGARLGFNGFIQTIFGAAIASLTALGLVSLTPGQNLDAITIGTLMVLVPGRALTNAMWEIMAGDILSGVARTTEALLIAAAIALGVVVALAIGP